MNLTAEIHKLWNEVKASIKHRKELQERIKSLEAQARVTHHNPLPRTGIDYAFPPHPPADKLRTAGISFVCRYLTGEGKALTRREADQLSYYGIDIVAIHEGTGGEAREGYNAGVRDATISKHALDNLKPKGEPPVYFACDFDAAGEGKINEVLEYIRGAVHTLGWYRVGLYAGFDVVRQAHLENRCKFLWQTYAWSHDAWYPPAQLRQVENNLHILGADCDLDSAVAADFGQFHV